MHRRSGGLELSDCKGLWGGNTRALLDRGEDMGGDDEAGLLEV